MSKKVVLRPAPSSTHRRQPLLRRSYSSGKAGTRLGEAVGGTAAVCCCGPCTVANIVYLAVYKVPASLCQQALKKRRQRRRRRSMQAGEEEEVPPVRRCTCGCCDDVGVRVLPTCGTDDDVAGVVQKSRSLAEEEDKEVMELEKEMWDRFYSTGFWRSPSQRDSPFSSQTITPSASAPNLQVLAVSTL